MITAWTIETATAGTPASRCMAAAPASSAPKAKPATTTPIGSVRAIRATAIAVNPYPGDRFWYRA